MVAPKTSKAVCRLIYQLLLDQSNEQNAFEDDKFIQNLVESVGNLYNEDYYDKFMEEISRLLKVNYCLKRFRITSECIFTLYKLNCSHQRADKEPEVLSSYVFTDALDRKA